MKIKTKLYIMFGSVFIFIIISIAIALIIVARVNMEKYSENLLHNVDAGIYNLAKEAFQLNQRAVKNSLKVAEYFVENKTVISQDEVVKFEIENQITLDKKYKMVPAMLINGQIVSKRLELVDRISEMTGGTVTIFQVIPEGLLRISTSVRRKDGTRAIGTYIPTTSPVYKAVMKGEIYYGRAFVVDDWYITAYKPILNNENRIIGVIYTGIPQAELTVLKERIASFDVGQSGTIFIVDGKGKLIIHPNFEADSVWDWKDTDGNYFFRKIIEEKEGSVQVSHRFPGEEDEKERIYYYKYLEEMNWHLISSITFDEIMAPFIWARNVIDGVIFFVLIVTFIILSIMIKRFTKPVNLIIEQIENIAKGNLTKRLDIDRKDEIGRIAKALCSLVCHL